MELSATEQLQYSTVRIEVDLESGDLGTGTGFFFRLCEHSDRHIPVLVTNKHVVSGGAEGRFLMTTMASDGAPVTGRYFAVTLGDLDKIFVCHPDPKVDLAALPIARLLQAADSQGLKLFYKSLKKSLIPTESEEFELTAVEDILMVGYPNGIWDSTNNLPVFRKGITATHPAMNYEGRDEFMIDAACFPGSSCWVYSIRVHSKRWKARLKLSMPRPRAFPWQNPGFQSI